jgi:hypothetical protein
VLALFLGGFVLDNNQRELTTLFPLNGVTEVNKTRIEVKKLTVRQIGEIAQLIIPVWEDVGEQDLLQLVAKHHEVLVKIMAVATRTDEEVLAEAPFDEFAALLELEWVYNKDVFMKGVWPLVRGIVAKMPNMLGQMQLTPSATMATAIQKATQGINSTPISPPATALNGGAATYFITDIRMARATNKENESRYDALIRKLTKDFDD